MNFVKINQNGQVSIPAKLRKALRLEVGDLLQVDKDSAERIVLTPVQVSSKATAPPKKGLTEEEIKKYEAQGVDIGLLRVSLERTPTERAETNRAMLEFIEEARKARKKIADAHP